jgi:hypothetical protein
MNINLVGRRLEGKTSLAEFLARRYKARVAWDVRCMIPGIYVYTPEDLQIAIEEREWERDTIVYRPISGDVENEFHEVCGVLFPPHFRYGGFAFLVDEAGELQTAHGISPDLLRIIKQHPTHPPRESVMILQTNHRLAEFNNSCKALLDELYIFQTTLPGDLDALEKHTGLPEITPIVRTLPKHHCVRYLYGRQDVGAPQFEVWDNPDMWKPPNATVVVIPDGNNSSAIFDSEEEENESYA